MPELPIWKYLTRADYFAEKAVEAQRRSAALVSDQARIAAETDAVFGQQVQVLQERLREESGHADINAAMEEEAEQKKRNFFLGALSWLDRPPQAARGVVEEAIWGGKDNTRNPEDFLEAIVTGARGEGPDSFATVLKNNGFGDVDLGWPGPLKNISKTDILGFGVDIGLDLLTFKPLGAVTGMASRAAASALRRAPGFGSLPTPTGTGLKPLALLTRDVAERVPVLGAVPRSVRTTFGKSFVPFYPLKQNTKHMRPDGRIVDLSEAAPYVGALTRLQRVAGSEAERIYKKTPFTRLNDEEKRGFFDLFIDEAGAGTRIGKAMQESNQPLVNQLWDEALRSPQRVKRTESLATAVRWYVEHWEPRLRGLAEELGLDSNVSNYMRRIFDLDPAEAAQSLARAGVSRPNQLGFLRQRTRPNATPDELRAAGVISDPEVILKFDLAQRRAATWLQDDMTTIGTRWGTQVTAENVGEFAAKNVNPDGTLSGWKFIRTRKVETYSPTKTSYKAILGEKVKNEKVFAVPDVLADTVMSYASPREVPAFLRQYDALQALWKASVTSIFPAFHSRNMGSNWWNSYLLDGLSGTGMAQAWGFKAGKKIKVQGRINDAPTPGASPLRKNKATGAPIADDVTGDLDIEEDILPTMMRFGGWGVGRFSHHEMRSAAMRGETRPREGLEKAVEWVLDSKWSLFRGGRTIGETVENTSKLGHVLTRIKKGDSLMDAINGPNGANKAMFVYDVQTPFMQNYFSVAFPFARWFTQNVPLQFERMLSKPQRFTGLKRFQTLLTQRDFTDAEISLLPSWMFEEMGGLWDTDDDGKVRLVAGTGLPVEDLNLIFTQTPEETLSNLFGMSTPFLRGVIETALNKSSFTGRDIDDPSYSNYYRRWQPILDKVPGAKEWLGYAEREVPDGRGGTKKTAYVENTQGMYWLTVALGRVLSSSRRIQQATDEDIGDMQSWLNLSTGLRISSRDLAQPIGRASITMDRIYEQHGEEWEQAALAHERWVRGEDPTKDAPTYTGEDYKAIRTRLLPTLFTEIEMVRQENIAQEHMVNPSDRKGIRRKRALLDYARTTFMGPELLAIEVYYSLDPNDPEFTGERGEPELNLFYDARTEALERIRDVAGEEAYQGIKKGHFLKKMPEAVRRVEQERQDAFDRLKPYWDMPQWRGLDPETDARVERVQGQLADIAVRWAGQKGASKRARRAYIQATGDVEGVRLLLRARRRGRNPARAAFRREHADDFIRWFSDLTQLHIGKDVRSQATALFT
jgi:hypothetical protein